MDKKMKHMEMIQAVISRMAGNSFALKGWAVTLVAALFALSEKDTNQFYYLVAYIPVMVFWVLDAYYLCQERRFRALYDLVRVKDVNDIDFSMATPMPMKLKDIWHLSDVKEKKKEMKLTVLGCFCSRTVAGFYLPLAAVTAGIIVICGVF